MSSLEKVLTSRFLTDTVLSQADDVTLMKFRKLNPEWKERIDTSKVLWSRIIMKTIEKHEESPDVKRSWTKVLAKMDVPSLRYFAVAVHVYYKTCSRKYCLMHQRIVPLEKPTYFQQLAQKFKKEKKLKRMTPLHFAVGCDIEGIVEKVVKLMDWKSPQNSEGLTPLHIAAYENKPRDYEILIKYADNINPRTYGFFLYTPLHLAAQAGHLEMCKVIMESLSNKNPQNSNGNTPLHCSVRSKKYDICKYLLEAGVDREQRNTDGYTALHLAASKNDYELCKLLVDHGANKEAVIRGKRPYDLIGKTLAYRKLSKLLK